MKKILALVLGAGLLSALFVWTILYTETGLLLIKKSVDSLGSPGLTIGTVKGKLAGQWSLQKLVLDIPSVAVSIADVEGRWRPAELLKGELGFAELTIRGSKVTVKSTGTEQVPSDSPPLLPKLFLPLGFTVENVKIEDLRIAEQDGSEIFTIEEAGFHLSGKDYQLHLNSFFLKGSGLDLTLHGSLDFDHDWNFDLLGGYRYSGPGVGDLSGTFAFNGPLNNPQVELILDQPGAIRVAGSITGLLQDPELKAIIAGENVELSSLSNSLPEIRLNTTEIHLSGTMEGCTADISAEVKWADLEKIHVAGSLSSDWQGMDFQALSLKNGEGTVTAKESWISWSDNVKWGGRFFFENVNPGIIRDDLPGSIDAEIKSQGEVVENGVEAFFEIDKLEGTLRQRQVTAQGTLYLTENEVLTDGLRLQSGELQGSAFIQQGRFSWADALSWSGDISFNDFDPSVVYPDLPGQVSGHIVGEGRQVEKSLEGSLAILDLSGQLRGQPLDGRGSIRYSNGRLETEGMSLQHGSSKVRIKGTAGEQFSVDFNVLSPDISQLIPLAGGSLSVKGRLTGSLQNPELQVDLAAEKLVYGDHHASDLKGKFNGQLRLGGEFRGSLQSGRITTSGLSLTGGSVEIAGTAEDHKVSLQVSSADGEIHMQAAGGYSNELWLGSLREIILRPADYGTLKQVDSASLRAGVSGVKLADLCLTDNEGQLCLDGELRTAQDDFNWHIKGSLSDGALGYLNRLQVLPALVSGTVNSTLEAEGDSGEVLRAALEIHIPEADFQLQESNEELGNILLNDTRLTGSLADGKCNVTVSTSMANGSTLKIYTEIGNLGKFPVNPERLSLAGKVDLSRVDLAFLAPLTGYLVEPTGKINGSFSLSGTVIEPRASGKLGIIEGGIALPDQGVTLQNVNLTLSTKETGVRLSAEASSGPGKLTASGEIMYAEDGVAGDLKIKGKDFIIVSLPEYEIQINPDLNFLFSKEKGELTGTVKIPKARITPEQMTNSVTVSSDVVLITGEEEVKDAGWPFYTKLDLQLGEDIYVDGYGLKGKLVGELQLQSSPNSILTGTGGLDLVESSFSIFGRSLDIERGRVLFTGGPIDNPGIDVRAQKKITAEQAIGDGYVVGVDVNGLVQNLQFHLFSDPFMEDTDILSYLLVGRSMAGSSEEENNIMGEAIAALGLEGGSEILKGLGNILTVDDLHLEGSKDKEDMSLVVGKRVTKDLYFGYDINMFNQQGVFRIRYDLTRGFSIETQTSTESTGTDILYTFEK